MSTPGSPRIKRMMPLIHETNAREAREVIAKLYVASKREGWEKGPTLSEAQDAAQDWLYKVYGHEQGAASELFWKDLGLTPPALQEAE
jgi:hypothetical protein